MIKKNGIGMAIVVVCAIVTIAMFTGCIEEETATPAVTVTPTPPLETVSDKMQKPKMVQVDDIEIGYNIFGDGKPIILIMGYGSTMDIWPPKMIEELAAKHQVIVFDNRGMGETTSYDKEFTIELFADDTAGLLDALGIEKADMFGWSMGSYIAQEIALNYPHKVDKLILYGSDCGGKEAIEASSETLSILTNQTGTPEEIGERLFKLLFPAKFLQANPDFYKSFPCPKETGSPQNMARQVEAIGNWNGTYNQLVNLNKSTLLITGTEDVIVPPKNSLIMVEQIPGAWLVQIEGGGHGLMYQYPEKISNITLSFLENRKND